MFTARYELSPYIKQISFAFKGLKEYFKYGLKISTKVVGLIIDQLYNLYSNLLRILYVRFNDSHIHK
jgi:hypothetical protein